MSSSRMRNFWRKKKVQFPLRLRLALWSGLLVLVISLGLLLFINITALYSFPGIVGSSNFSFTDNKNASQLPPVVPPLLGSPIASKTLNPLSATLIFDLQNTSLIALGLITILGSVGAYWFAGIALRPVRKVSASVRHISANTLHTRLTLDGPQDEVKELADAFDIMLGRLQHTFELQNNFIGDIAHELRTPLTSIRTNLEVVTTDEDATIDDYHSMADAQERALLRLERLIADLHILARGEQPFSEDEISLLPLIEEVRCDLERTAQERQVTLQLISNTEPIVHGDATLLARAFSNLIENGINYNRVGGKVVISIDSKDGKAVVTVADDGIGIVPEKQVLIFDRFYRIEASRARHTGGAGLGLSIVKTIVQQHGGQVKVESTPTIGSTFTILLPL